MKKIFAIALVSVMFMMSACAQKLKESQVPVPTKEAFKKQYPNTLAKWEKEDGNYEVDFKHDRKDMSAVISDNGTIIETETGIPVADLPQSARDYVKSNYAGATIKEAG